MTVDGVPYTVFSDSDWIYDATGATESCTNKSTHANYIRISSTVTSSVVAKRIKPVVIRSFVAPRVGDFGANQGTLTVLVRDQLDKPVPNMAVNLAGPSAYLDYTNEFGCAVFGHIAVGSYTATLNLPGWVDKNRNQVSVQTNTVNAGSTNTTQMSYAQAAQIDANFETKVGASAVQAAKGNALTVGNSSVPGGVVIFPSPTAPAANPLISATKAVPVPGGYTAYAGDCAWNDPSKYDPAYFTKPGNPGFVNVIPGGTVPVTVREPSLNIQILKKVGAPPAAPLPGAHVVVTLTSPGSSSTSCVARSAHTTMLDPATGTFRVRVTGKEGKTSRTIVASFRRHSFLDFLYFTDFETLDPFAYTTKALQQWADAACGQGKYRAARDNNCQEIQFVSADANRGPFHTNDNILACGGYTLGRKKADRIEITGLPSYTNPGTSGS